MKRTVLLKQLRLRINPETRKEPPDLEDVNRRLYHKAAQALRMRPREILSLRILHHSIDARKKPVLYDIYTVEATLRKEAVLPRGMRLSSAEDVEKRYVLPSPGGENLKHRPVVVGAGPAGLFGALALARAGYRPILIERGDDTAARDRAVERFWKEGMLDPESNIQFGAGGAGTYSDGKLYTGVRDRQGLGFEVLRILVEMGAPGDLLTEAHPHIGTDALKLVVGNMIAQIEALGGEVRFRTKLLKFHQKNGRLTGIETSGGEIEGELLLLAIGHSARDTVEHLLGQGIAMSQKPFAVGFRVAHPQILIDQAQYGTTAPVAGHLPPAIYKLTGKGRRGRGVYSFCMCPGGQIVNASSEPGFLAVNGMSNRDRDGAYANSAIVVTVGPEDYDRSGHALDGMRFQRAMEERAYLAGDGKIPVAFYKDLAGAFLKVSSFFPAEVKDAAPLDSILSQEIFCGGWTYADLSEILPSVLTEEIVSAMEGFGRRIRGFDAGDALFAGVESRTSSPVRMERGEDGEALGLTGLYPCGEGAGYAGGIVSAAMDGIRQAERMIQRYARPAEGL